MVMSDALVRGIADRLTVEPMSAAEIAAHLDVPAATVRRRLRKLVEAGIIECRGKTRRRGVLESLYSMRLGGGLIEYGELARVPQRLRDEGTIRLLRLMFREAIESGEFHARPENVALRFPLPLDERGLVEARELHEALVRSIVEVAERAEDRIESERGETSLACATVLYFEAPAIPVAPAPRADDLGFRSPARFASGDRAGLLRAFGDPFRMFLLDALALAPAGAGELAERSGASVEKVRYELKRMKKEGVVTVHSRRVRRGTQELVYLGEPRNGVLSATDAAATVASELQGIYRESVTGVFRDALAATHAGVFRDREDHVMARLPLQFDSRAFAAISDLLGAALERLFDLRVDCLARSAVHEGELQAAISGLFLFEQPRAERRPRSRCAANTKNSRRWR